MRDGFEEDADTLVADYRNVRHSYRGVVLGPDAKTRVELDLPRRRRYGSSLCCHDERRHPQRMSANMTFALLSR